MKRSEFFHAFSFALLLFAALVVSAKSHATESRRVYFFGNSLINHLSGSDETTLPHWLNRIARADGRGFFVDGHWGSMREFAAQYPPVPVWSFKEVRGNWNPDRRPFGKAGFDAIVFNPTNYVQGEHPSAPYTFEPALGGSPVSATADLLSKIRVDGVEAPAFVYEGWADLAPFLWGFPPSDRRARKYHRFNRDDYHDWYETYVEELAREGHDVTLIPVASVLAELMLETVVKDVPITDIYLDDAPHGAPTLYFLAALVTYPYVFQSKLPREIRMSESIHPIVRENLAEIVTFIEAKIALPERKVVKAKPVETKTARIDELPAPSQPMGLKTPALAMGLNGLADWSSQHPFIDVMKTARPWIGHLPGRWGGMEAAEVEATGVLDKHGWPTRLPQGVERLEALLLTDQDERAHSIAGRYRLTYRGEGSIELVGRAENVKRKPGEIWFDYKPGEGLVGVSIAKTDPKGNGNYIRDISIIRDDLIALHEVGGLFNPDWIRLVEDIRVLRFMDWQFTNGSPQVTWSDRPVEADYTWVRRGAPLEVMLRLVAEVNADPWFNMPHKADDEYIRNFASEVRTYLPIERKAYVEYSNEVWNFLFPQAEYAVEQAKVTWGNGVGDDGWMRFAGKRAGEVSAIWSAVFGDETDERLVRVIATHTDWPGLEQAMFREIADVAASFDAYAVTGYFGYALGSDEMAGTVLEWLEESNRLARSMAEAEGLSGATLDAFVAEHRYDVALSRVTAHLRRSDLAVLAQNIFPTQAAIAARQGLDLIMYEGGTHITALGPWTGNETLTEFFAYANYTPEIAGLYDTLLKGFDRAGGKMFNAFVDVAQPSQWGSWGAYRYLGDQNLRAAKLMEWNARGSGDGDYRHGVTSRGTSRADRLAGTVLADFLIGNAGDDHFVVAGSDRVHGGPGFDRVVLPGKADDYTSVRAGDRLILTGLGQNVTLVAVEEIVFAETPDLRVSTVGFGG